MKTNTNSASLIQDGQSLVAALSRFGHSIPVYDDGFGPLYIHRDSMGISGIVRAQTWEDAYSICEDEFFPEADETLEELQKDYGFRSEDFKIIRASDGTERRATAADYDANGGRLPDGAFVRWETVETPDAEAWADNGLFQESFGFRPNGANSKDTQKHGIYAKDLNGDSLELLTAELLARLKITLQIEGEADL